jgi:hypothetical protein
MKLAKDFGTYIPCIKSYQSAYLHFVKQIVVKNLLFPFSFATPT